MPRRIPLWAIIVAVCLLSLGVFGTFDETDEVCRSCLASRHKTRFPAWTTVDLHGSRVLDEAYGGSHDHSWEFSHHEQRILGLPWVRGCGNPLGNPVPMTFLDDEGFRKLVLARLADGSLARKEWQAWCEVPAYAYRWPEDQREEYRSRARKALALVRESGRSDTTTYPFYWWSKELAEAGHPRK